MPEILANPQRLIPGAARGDTLPTTSAEILANLHRSTDL